MDTLLSYCCSGPDFGSFLFCSSGARLLSQQRLQLVRDIEHRMDEGAAWSRHLLPLLPSSAPAWDCMQDHVADCTEKSRQPLSLLAEGAMLPLSLVREVYYRMVYIQVADNPDPSISASPATPDHLVAAFPPSIGTSPKLIGNLSSSNNSCIRGRQHPRVPHLWLLCRGRPTRYVKSGRKLDLGEY